MALNRRIVPRTSVPLFLIGVILALMPGTVAATTYAVTGDLVSAAGSPVAGRAVEVHIAWGTGAETHTVHTNANGTFSKNWSAAFSLAHYVTVTIQEAVNGVTGAPSRQINWSGGGVQDFGTWTLPPGPGTCELTCDQSDPDGGKIFWDGAVAELNGCSCDPACGIRGDCCDDVNLWCCAGGPADNCREVPPASGNWVKQGTQYLTSVTVTSASGNAENLRDGEPTDIEALHFSQVPASDEANRTAVGLTSYKVYSTYELDGWGVGICWAIHDPGWDTEGSSWWLTAQSSVSNKVSSDVFCQAEALKFPEPVTLSAERTAWNDDVDTGFAADEYFPLMTKMATRQSATNSWARCGVTTNGGTWRVVSSATGLAQAECGFRFAELSSAQLDPLACPAPSLLDLEGYSGSSGGFGGTCSTNGAGVGVFTVSADADDPGPNEAMADIRLASEADTYCFLQGVEVNDITADNTPGSCEIYSRHGDWRLRALANHGSFSICRASCVQDARRAGTTAAEPNGWPPAATVTIEDDVDTLGARLRLFQSGSYDMPVVFFEGFDSSNRSSAPYYLREGEPLFRMMRDIGVDIWVVDAEDGGQALIETMREYAAALDVAYRHGGWYAGGRKLAAVGVSMGALTGRAMLAGWEQGIYHDPTHPEFIATDLGAGCAGGPPCSLPVSYFAASNGPQLGANVPAALQKALQDFSYMADLGDMTGAINSAAATNMLIRRINTLHRWHITEYCGLADMVFGDTTMRNSDQTLTDSIHGGLNAGGPYDASDDDRLLELDPKPVQLAAAYAGHEDQACVRWRCPDWEEDNGHCNEDYVCDQWAYRREMVYFNDDTSGGAPLGLNRRGVLGNGYPQNLSIVGYSNARWEPQSCANFESDAVAQKCLDTVGAGDFTANTRLGGMKFKHDGKLGLCERDTRKYVTIGADSLRPGDLNGSTIQGLSIAPVPANLRTLDVWQNIPFVFIPTESALHCGPDLTSDGIHDDASCQAYNDANDQFDKVMTRLDGKNAGHSAMDQLHALDLMAMLFDALALDADGYCNPGTNPFALQYLLATAGTDWACLGSSSVADMDDYDPTVHEGAVELCDCKDNDQANGVDDGLGTNACGGPCGCEDSTDTCTVGVGACAVTENLVCHGWYAMCDAEPGEPSTEICGDAIDSDCDGTTNDHGVGQQCGTVGLGQCERASYVECTADGSGSYCHQAVPGVPEAERCDLLDWDCNGDHYYYTVAYNGDLQKRWPSPAGNYCDGPADVSGTEPAVVASGLPYRPLPESKAADLAWPRLLGPTGEFARICGNGIDEDGDGLTDCNDPGCNGAPGCPVDPPVTCTKNCPHDAG